MTIDKKIVDMILDKDKTYYHCQEHGIIYADKEDNKYIIPLIDLVKLTGEPGINNPAFNEYMITTGLCSRACFDEYVKRELDDDVSLKTGNDITYSVEE